MDNFDDLVSKLEDDSERGTIRQRNERKILHAAEIVFATEGYKGASIERIAEIAGLPRANIMYYFKSKEKLYQRTLYDMCLAWEGPANKLTVYSDPRKAMEGFIRAKIDLARDRPFGSKLWVSEVLRGATMLEDYYKNHLSSWIDSRVEVFNHWMTLGLIKKIDARTLLYSIWATTQHYADFSDQIRILNGGEPLSDRQYEQIKRELVIMYWRALGIEDEQKNTLPRTAAKAD